MLEGLRLLARPGVHLAGGEHTTGGVDLAGIELGPGRDFHNRNQRTLKQLQINKKKEKRNYQAQPDRKTNKNSTNKSTINRETKALKTHISTGGMEIHRTRGQP